ncbi:RES family NAD+ phosphorylase, partial [Flavobacterium terrae]
VVCHLEKHPENNMKKTPLCSECFKDEGLKLDAFQIGIANNETCQNCDSSNGRKLTIDLINELAFRFFVQGSILKVEYGSAPLIQYNEYQKTQIDFDEPLNTDVKLFERELKVGFFHYGPRLWTLGHVEPLIELQSKSTRKKIVERIINEFPIRYLNKEDSFYRVRKNPEFPKEINQYDSNPKPGNGRLDSSDLSVFYGSQDLEVCIHESRVTVNDELYIATLKPLSKLKLLDLTTTIQEENFNEFESLDIAVKMLHSAGNHSYEISRDIAKSILEAGFDGIIYPSFFSDLRTGSTGNPISKFKEYSAEDSHLIPNIALFGYPIKENKILVQSVNKLILDKVEYSVRFGPAKFE